MLALFAALLIGQTETSCLQEGQRLMSVDGVATCVDNFRETMTYNVDRHPLWCRRVTSAAATYGCSGITVPTMTCTPSSSPSDSGSFMTITTAATINTPCGHNSAVGQSRPAWRPVYSIKVRTDSAIANRRVWHGLTESALAGVAIVTSNTASSVDFIAIGFDTAVSANWMVCSGDGTTYSCLDSGVAVQTSTNYVLVLDWSVAGRLDAQVNGVRVRKTTHLSTGAINLGIQNSVNNNDAAARAHLLGSFVLVQGS